MHRTGKIGSSSLFYRGPTLEMLENGSAPDIPVGPIYEVFESVAAQVHELYTPNSHFALVTSGAIAFGRASEGVDVNRVLTVPEKQALASIGQIPLMNAWRDAFKKHKLTVSQVLVTNEVLGSRKSNQKSHLTDTFAKIFDMGVVPIINENDAVAVREIVQGDNDKLSALIANLVGARRLHLLGTADAIYKDYPDNTKRLASVRLGQRKLLRDICHDTTDPQATGGMKTKLEAASIFLRSDNSDNSKVLYVANAKFPSAIAEAEAGIIGSSVTLLAA